MICLKFSFAFPLSSDLAIFTTDAGFIALLFKYTPKMQMRPRAHTVEPTYAITCP